MKYALIYSLLLYLFTPLSSWSQTTHKELTLEEKVGQLLIVHFNGDRVNGDAELLVQKLGVGGVIYYNWANGLNSPLQVRELSQGLQDLAKNTRLSIPLFITTDQEGGRVSRLTHGFTVFPGNRAVALTRSLDLCEKSAFFMGQEMHDVGINLNLAPVVDINTQVRNPVIGISSFSEDPRTVISFARASLKGFHRANVMTTLKHFPGHGDVEIDSHEGLPILKKDLVDLEKGELRPFRELSEHTEAILTAHMMVPALDEFHCTTLSKKSLDYLRQEIGFKGLIISDSLVMEGLLKCCGTIEEAAVRAFQAGCDLILLGGKQLIGAHQNLELSTNDIEKIHQALVKAVQTGIISEDRLNVSIRRILDFKSKLQKGRSLEKIELSLHQECAEEIAKRSIQAIGSLKSLFMGPSKIWIVHPYIIEETLLKAGFGDLSHEVYFFPYDHLNPTFNWRPTQNCVDSDLVIFCTYDFFKNSWQAEMLDLLVNMQKPVVVVSVNEFSEITHPHLSMSLMTFSPTITSLKEAYKYLKNDLEK
ncbi:MAG: glycoside hydrolase family 3 protein [Chlamydiales bacterium]|nr:glycoside hydrolase family 3 protein [Chlamydiales bacterium]